MFWIGPGTGPNSPLLGRRGQPHKTWPCSATSAGHVSHVLLHTRMRAHPSSPVIPDKRNGLAQDKDHEQSLPPTKEKSWQSSLMRCSTRPIGETFGPALGEYNNPPLLEGQVFCSIHSTLTLKLVPSLNYLL
jgi:hypothetical protein